MADLLAGRKVYWKTRMKMAGEQEAEQTHFHE
ncbi:uncharacterized protein G2W53_000663 [Senna tora]|uniref:Uncharacterized protein n=1 Tax=Senna tora TaxID=362788 RepID=A0A834XEE6_9FABA|nr:uncharacterized protein G2W53_000663 [Senna tora]